MRKKHGSVPKLHTCSGLDSHNEQKHWHSKCHYKRNSGSPSAGANNPTPKGKACGVTKERWTARCRPFQLRRPPPLPQTAKQLEQRLWGRVCHSRRAPPAEDENQPFRQGDGDPGPLAPRVSWHGWRKSPWGLRTPFTPGRRGKKGAADPRGGGPPTRLIFHLGLDDENP
jgi:hypothetical protein